MGCNRNGLAGPPMSRALDKKEDADTLFNKARLQSSPRDRAAERAEPGGAVRRREVAEERQQKESDAKRKRARRS